MSDLSLLDRIVKSLTRSPESSASELSKILKVSKSEVNSILYKHKNVKFKCTDGQPPRWSNLKVDSAVKVREEKHLIRDLQGSVHIDAQGGDWELKVAVGEMSRNDPIALVEYYGPRKCVVTVSKQVVSTEESASLKDRTRIPDSVVAIAASVLSWEIAKHQNLTSLESFEFEETIRDIYLSIAAHSRRLESAN